jgi:hypothetical protein
MTHVNPVLHMDKEFMWRWFEVDESGQTSFASPKAFFSKAECRRDYDAAMRRSKRNMT